MPLPLVFKAKPPSQLSELQMALEERGVALHKNSDSCNTLCLLGRLLAPTTNLLLEATTLVGLINGPDVHFPAKVLIHFYRPRIRCTLFTDCDLQ